MQVIHVTCTILLIRMHVRQKEGRSLRLRRNHSLGGQLLSASRQIARRATESEKRQSYLLSRASSGSSSFYLISSLRPQLCQQTSVYTLKPFSTLTAFFCSFSLEIESTGRLCKAYEYQRDAESGARWPRIQVRAIYF